VCMCVYTPCAVGFLGGKRIKDEKRWPQATARWLRWVLRKPCSDALLLLSVRPLTPHGRIRIRVLSAHCRNFVQRLRASLLAACAKKSSATTRRLKIKFWIRERTCSILLPTRFFARRLWK
jgi:hypothetical protein